jgi:hypothetical protein
MQNRPDHLFKPGQSGNPAGRPKGSRNKLSEAFLKVLAEDFEAHGEKVIERLRTEQPAQYANVIAKLMPKLMELSGPDGTEIPLAGVLKIVRARDKSA